MRAVTEANELKIAEKYLAAGVYDELIAQCESAPSICAVHDRLKAVYIGLINNLKKSVAGGTLPRSLMMDISKVGPWAIVDGTTKGKEALAGELGNLMTDAGASWTQASQVLSEATQGRQGPSEPTSMSAADMLTAYQMYEDRVPWKEIADTFDKGHGNSADRMQKRLRPLARIVKKYCPIPKRKQIHS